jgi:serine/threonine protein kinase/tetratricopeptide (TPR) repeat protein
VNANQWERAKQIFDLALSYPPSERHDFAVLACDGDQELLLEVTGLLSADERAGSFLKTLSIGAAVHWAKEPFSGMLQPGEVVSGRFRVVRFLGRGGMGEVYEAADLELGVHVALKTIRPDLASSDHALLRFKKEVQLTRRITHPNVCRIFDIGRHVHSSESGKAALPEFTFLTMELLEGYTLLDLLRAKGKLHTNEALPIVEQAADALTAAHSLGIIHRDIKPSNIMLVSKDGETRVVVTDFGLARFVATADSSTVTQVSPSLTAKAQPIGTVAYMAPEQLEGGEVTRATDIYALGLVMYEMAAGRRPFDESLPFGGLGQRVKSAPPSPRTHVPELDLRWEAAILRCLQIDPAARFQNTREIVTALKARSVVPTYASSRTTAQPIVAGPVPVPTPVKYRRKKLISIAAIILLAGVALSWAFFRYYEQSSIPKGQTVVLTDVRNNVIGDTRFDSVTELLRGQLSQSPHVHVMTRQKMQDELERMNKLPDTGGKGVQHEDVPITATVARGIALRVGAPRVVWAAVSRITDEDYALDVEIQQPGSEPERARRTWQSHWTWHASPGADSKSVPSGLLEAVGYAGAWTRRKLGEARDDVAELDAPPQDVTTASWDALLEFWHAEKFDVQHKRNEAITALQNAISTDSGFALAYMRLGDIQVSLRQYDEGYRAYATALSKQNQQRLSRREHDRLKGIFALDTSDFPSALAAFTDYALYYPNDYLGPFYQAYPLMMMGRAPEALNALRKAGAIDGSAYSVPAHIARFNLILQDFDKASEAIRKLRQMGYADDADDIEAGLEFMQHHYDRTLELYRKLQGSEEALYRTRSYLLLACALAELGRYADAIDSLDKGIRSDISEGDNADRADKLLARAYLHLRQHDYPETLDDTRQALELDRSLQRSATAAALIGRAASEAKDPPRKALVAELHSIERGLGSFNFDPISKIVRTRIRGEVLLAEDHAGDALKQFELAADTEAAYKIQATEQDYLARGLLIVADRLDATKVADAETTSSSPARDPLQLRARALQAYGRMAQHEGQIWQLPEESPPGYYSDEVFSYAQLAARIGNFDAGMRSALEEYCNRRQHADPVLNAEVNGARQLLQRDQGVK